MQHALINVLPVEKGDFDCLYVVNSDAGCLVFKHRKLSFSTFSFFNLHHHHHYKCKQCIA